MAANWQRIALALLAFVALILIRSVAKQSASMEADIARLEQEAAEEITLPEMEIDAEQKRAAKMREGIEDLIRRDPDSAVGLIRRWMARES